MHARAEARKQLEPGAVTAGHAADRTAGSEFLAHANEKHGHVAVGALARAFDRHDRVAALLPWFGGSRPCWWPSRQACLPPLVPPQMRSTAIT